ncbi:MAG: lytic transglycosylase domain-containing protein [Deltaproteobacteria bacterium]|nr:lytic transglycosylase domain-containing protein [Deltaproteobacteria bacterium]
MKILIFILFVFLFFIQAKPSFCDIYYYVDESGISHFTDYSVSKKSKLIIKSRKKKSHVSGKYSNYISQAAKRFNLNPHLIRAVIKVESDFCPKAVSKHGALGLMQIMPKTAKELSLKNPFCPKENIMAGTRYLKQMLDLFNGDLKLALAAYNAGPDKVISDNNQISGETRRYVEKVLNYLNRYNKKSKIAYGKQNL